MVFCREDGPRLRYTFALLFGCLSQVPYRLCFSAAEYQAAQGPKLHYGLERLNPAELFIPAGGLLTAVGVVPQDLAVRQHEGLPAFFFQAAPQADFPFDLPAVVFFLATRYEEYLPFTPDRWGRFPAAQSVATAGHFLEQPLAEQWVQRLLAALRQRFPDLPQATGQTFQFRVSYDIDMAWAFRHRPDGGWGWPLLKDLLRGRWAALAARWQVWRGEPDPFDVFAQLQQAHAQWQLAPGYFFLLADYHRYDPNTSHRHPALRALIRDLAQEAGAFCGIHPSLASNQHPERLAVEKARLEAILEQPITASRQHFLVLRFPATYRRLLAVGITQDYSLGFADAIGFRGGISRAYPWYDLAAEATTALQIQPFIAMDVTLKQYLALPPATAVARVAALLHQVAAVQGTAFLLWHNSSFAVHQGWAGWEAAYAELLRYGAALQAGAGN